MKPNAVRDTPIVLIKRVKELFEQSGAGWEDRWLVAFTITRESNDGNGFERH
jgi:hypothetical protein